MRVCQSRVIFVKNGLDRELILRRHSMFVVDTVESVFFDF